MCIDKNLKEFGLTDNKLERLRANYLTAIQLTHDSEDDANPREKRQAAVEIFKSNLALVKSCVDPEHHQKPKICAILALCHMFIAKASHGYDSDNQKHVVQHLKDCERALISLKRHPGMGLAVLILYNEFGAFHFNVTNYQESEKYLKNAELVYENRDEVVELFDPLILFEANGDSPTKALLKQYLATCSYLANIYYLNKLFVDSIKYRHINLSLLYDLPENDVIAWVNEVAATSETLVRLRCFDQVNYYLLVAEQVLQDYVSRNEKKTEAQEDGIKFVKAEISYFLAEAGLSLLTFALDDLAGSTVFSPIEVQNLRFDKVRLKIADKRLPTQNPKNLAEAEPVFCNVLKWLQESKAYYTLDEHASNHFELVMHEAKAYQLLLGFDEHNKEHRIKMHKNTIKLFEDLKLRLDNKEHLDILKMLWFELGKLYYKVLEIHLTEDRGEVEVISNYRSKAYENIKAFVDSEKLNEKIFCDKSRRILKCYLILGNLYGRSLDKDASAKVENVRKSLKVYGMFLNYCQSNKVAEERLAPDVHECRRCVDALSEKIEKLTKEPDSYNAVEELVSICNYKFNLLQV